MSTFADINDWLDPSGSKLVEAARARTEGFGQRYYRGPQLLLAAMESGMLDNPLLRQGCDPEDAVNWLAPIAEKSTTRYAGASEPIMENAMANALLAKGRDLERQLNQYDIVEAILSSHLGFVTAEMRGSPFSWDEVYLEVSNLNQPDVEDTPAGATGVAKTGSGATKGFDQILSKFATNLSDGAEKREKGLYQHRIESVRQIAGVLGRMTRPNPLIVGDPGVGKTTLIEGLASWLKTDDAPEWLKDVQIFAINCSAVVAGAGYRGQLEERIQQIVDAAILRKDVILFLDEMHILGDAAATGSSNLLGLFSTYLSKGSFRMMASANTKGYEGNIKSNDGFVRRFEVVKLDEPSKEEALEMLKTHVPAFTKHYEREVSDDALATVVSSCERYMPSLRFPDKAISVLDSAFQKIRDDESVGEKLDRGVDEGDVLHVVSRETNIPISRLDEMEHAKLAGLEEFLESRVFDQTRATNAMAKSIQNLRLGLSDPARTKVSFMLVGPPGTGKTELAKAVAEYLMGSEKALVRFNMSEFQTGESYQRLVGPPPGYVGYEAGGELTNRLMENPYSVVLFDEIEKGSSRVFDVLLQVLSDGHLTDSHGRFVDCKNSVFMLTSNALADVGDASEAQIRQALLQYSDPHKQAMGPTFRREFIDRLEIITYGRLSNNTLKKIATREVGKVVDRVNSSDIMSCKIEVGDDTMEWLISQIDSKTTGARSVQRLIEANVSRLISDGFIHGTISDGGSYVLSVGDKGKLDIVKTG